MRRRRTSLSANAVSCRPVFLADLMVLSQRMKFASVSCGPATAPIGDCKGNVSSTGFHLPACRHSACTSGARSLSRLGATPVQIFLV